MKHVSRAVFSRRSRLFDRQARLNLRYVPLLQHADMYKPVLTLAIPVMFVFALLCATLVIAQAAGIH
jgi:hypothetical protein